jgi:hypothetical protein
LSAIKTFLKLPKRIRVIAESKGFYGQLCRCQKLRDKILKAFDGSSYLSGEKAGEEGESRKGANGLGAPVNIHYVVNELENKKGNAQRQNDIDGRCVSCPPKLLRILERESLKKYAYLKNASVSKLAATAKVSQFFLAFCVCPLSMAKPK